jgi:hypothetical protein
VVATIEVADGPLLRLADVVAPALASAGFVRHDDDDRARLTFHRLGGDGFVQALSVIRAAGALPDGTPLQGRVEVRAGTYVPGAASVGRAPGDLGHFSVGSCTQTTSGHADPSAEALHRLLSDAVLPWLDATRDRASLARWAAEDPERIFPPRDRPRYARLLVEWGEPGAAQAVLRHLRRRRRHLLEHPEALRAQRLLDSARR